MKQLYGPDKIRRFLKFELDSYLRARGGEAIEELPLERVENQPYIHYRKGSLVMYLLQDQIGEANGQRRPARVLQAVRLQGRALSHGARPGARAARPGAGRQAAADHRPVREDHPLGREGEGRDGDASAPTASGT